MADWSGKVRPGDPLRMPAATLNNAIDAARAERGHRFDRDRPGAITSLYSPAIVRILNQTGSSLDVGSVVKLGSPIIDPTENLDEWQAKPSFAGEVPDADDNHFAVLLEPIAAGEIGRAVVDGMAQVRIDVADEGHGFAAPAASFTDQLASASTGAAKILWKEAGTGLKRATVQLGPAGAAGASPISVSPTNPPTGSPVAGTIEVVLISGHPLLYVYGGASWYSLVSAKGLASPAAFPADLFQFDETTGIQVVQDGTNPWQANVSMRVASLTQMGAITTGTQTIGGNKTVNGNVSVIGDLSVSHNASVGNDLTVGDNATVGLSLAWGGNDMGPAQGFCSIRVSAATGFNMPAVGGWDPALGPTVPTVHSIYDWWDGTTYLYGYSAGGTDPAYGIWSGGLSGAYSRGGTASVAGLQFIGGIFISGSFSGLTSVGVTAPLASTGGTTPTISITTDSTTLDTTGGTLRIKDLGVSTSKLADGAVTASKLADTIDLGAW